MLVNIFYSEWGLLEGVVWYTLQISIRRVSKEHFHIKEGRTNNKRRRITEQILRIRSKHFVYGPSILDNYVSLKLILLGKQALRVKWLLYLLR